MPKSYKEQITSSYCKFCRRQFRLATSVTHYEAFGGRKFIYSDHPNEHYCSGGMLWSQRKQKERRERVERARIMASLKPAVFKTKVKCKKCQKQQFANVDVPKHPSYNCGELHGFNWKCINSDCQSNYWSKAKCDFKSIIDIESDCDQKQGDNQTVI